MTQDLSGPPTTEQLATLAETMTIKQIATHLDLSRQHVATLLRNRGITPAPDTAPRATRRGPTVDPETWTHILADYRAGDSPIVLERRYGIAQASIARYTRALADTDGFPHRDGRAAERLRAAQLAEADAVRHRIRSGALEDAAADLGTDAATLRAVLDAHGLLLHDLAGRRTQHGSERMKRCS